MTSAEQLAEQISDNRKKSKKRCMWRDACILKPLRNKLGLPAKDVANAIGISDVALYGIENGSDPTLSNALKLAKFYGKTIEEIWTS